MFKIIRPHIVCCITAVLGCRTAYCAVVRAEHNSGASLWQTVSHFTLTASVFTVINQWWLGGCHFTLWSSPAAWFCPTNSQPALVGGYRNTHTHTDMHMHTLTDMHAHTHTHKVYAQHKAGCWSNYRNMTEHDEAGNIRTEIEWAEEKMMTPLITLKLRGTQGRGGGWPSLWFPCDSTLMSKCLCFY